jgi:hypothetical protein
MSNGAWTCLACMDRKTHPAKYLVRHEQSHRHREAVKHRLSLHQNAAHVVESSPADSIAPPPGFQPYLGSIEPNLAFDDSISEGSGELGGGDEDVLFLDGDDTLIFQDNTTTEKIILDLIDGDDISDDDMDEQQSDAEEEDEGEPRNDCMILTLIHYAISLTACEPAMIRNQRTCLTLLFTALEGTMTAGASDIRVRVNSC